MRLREVLPLVMILSLSGCTHIRSCNPVVSESDRNALNQDLASRTATVTLKDGYVFAALNVTVSAESLRMRPRTLRRVPSSRRGQLVRGFPIGEISTVAVKSRAGGVGEGAMIGFAVGALLGGLIGATSEVSESDVIDMPSQSEMTVGAALIFGLLGGVTGGVIGGGVGSATVYDLSLAAPAGQSTPSGQ